MIDFKIALYGQIDNDTKFGFTYPDSFNPINVTPKDDWLRSISEPRDARVFKTDDPIYTIWKNEHGNYYASIFPNKKDSRNGYLILTLFVGKMQPKSGKRLESILTDLIQMIVEQEVRDKERVAAYLDTVADAFEADNVPASTAQKSPQKAFRAYASEDELFDLLQNINQEEYNGYKRVMLVPRASVPTQLTTDYVELKNVIRHLYNVMLPADGTQVNRKMVKDGETLEITYSKTGFEQEKRSVTVQRTPNNVYRIEGNTIHIVPAAEAGIVFMRGFTLDVCSVSGVRVKEFYVNNQLHKYGEKVKMDDAREYSFIVKANGYETFSMTKRASEMTNTLKIRLQPLEMDMPVTMNYHGRDIRGKVMVKADDPLYPYFKNRDYHFEIKGGKGNNNNALLNKILWAVAALGLIIGGIFIYKSCEEETEVPPIITHETVNTDTTSTGRKKEVTVDPQEENVQKENAIIVYLKRKGKKDIWEKDSLKALPDYEEIFDFLQKGEIEKVIEWKYSVREDDVNSLWKEIVNSLDSIKDNSEMRDKAIVELKKSVKGDSIILMNLKNSLSLILKPKEKETKPQTPNTSQETGGIYENIKNVANRKGSGTANDNPNKKGREVAHQ